MSCEFRWLMFIAAIQTGNLLFLAPRAGHGAVPIAAVALAVVLALAFMTWKADRI